MTHHEHGHPDVKLYLMIFGVLLVMTIVTVLVSYWHLPPLPAITLGLAIATFKASLVAAFFMHLKGERVLIYGLLGITLVCMAILFILPISDAKGVAPTRVVVEAPAEAHSDH
jgi:cytochrome c oxidase subunit 4